MKGNSDWKMISNILLRSGKGWDRQNFKEIFPVQVCPSNIPNGVNRPHIKVCSVIYANVSSKNKLL
jgi:hypothetical protein